MSDLAVVTDSSAELDADAAETAGISVVPIEIVVDGEPSAELDLDVDVFYQRLAAGAGAGTSLPSPERLARTYDAAKAGGAIEVLSIHLDGRTSGVVNAARLAAAEVDVPVTVVDARTASFGVAVCALAAARVAAVGGTAAAAAELIAALAPAIGNVFVAGAPPGGRVPSAPGLPLLSFFEGRTHVLEPRAGDLVAPAALAGRIPGDRELHTAVGYAHRDMSGPADELARLVGQLPNVLDVVRYRVGPSVGAHTGPWSYGAFWWPA